MSTNFNPHQTIDEDALNATLEGIPESGHFYEAVYLTRDGMPSCFSLFSAVRVVCSSRAYTLVRLYIGSEITSDDQLKALQDAMWVKDALINYDRVYPERYGK